MNYKKPFYSLRISSKNCAYKVCVNGAFVEVHRSAEALEIEYPINQWLKDGKNTIELYQHKLPDYELKKKIIRYDAEVSAHLYVKELGTDKKVKVSSLCFNGKSIPRVEGRHMPSYENIELTKISSGSTAAGTYAIDGDHLKLDINGNYSVAEPEYCKGAHKGPLLSQEVCVPLPLPEWQFFSADKHPIHFDLNDEEYEAFRIEVMAEYQHLYDALEKKDWQAFEALVKERGDEYDQAFYLEPGETIKSFIARYELSSSDPEWELEPLDLGRMDISVAFNQQLVWMHGWDRPMSHCLWLSHTKSDMCKKYFFTFAQFNGKWKVVR